jgi:SAM-dependent methyltransferase
MGETSEVQTGVRPAEWKLGFWDGLQYRFLRRFFRNTGSDQTPRPEAGVVRVRELFGDEFVDSIRGKTVIEFGCGHGFDAVDLALAGASRVIGLDLQLNVLRHARDLAAQKGVAEICEFAETTETQADIVMSIDAFEHFADPLDILRKMARLCKPDGRIWIQFGYTWLHPFGGHLFSLNVFPWAHLIFSETALCRWRADFKTDGARRFGEVEGGLNRMTLARFDRIVAQCGIAIEKVQEVPIRAARMFHCRLTREFLTSVVRYRLKP